MMSSGLFRTVVSAAVVGVVLSGLGVAQNAPSEVPQNAAPSQQVAVPNQPQTEKVYRIGNGVTPPKILQRVDPKYAKKARYKKIQGTVALSLVVGTDGVPRDIMVKQGLGYGLDEEAIKALKQWRFEPSEKDGVPVPVMVTVGVNFHLYQRGD
jgi:TonB family protein